MGRSTCNENAKVPEKRQKAHFCSETKAAMATQKFNLFGLSNLKKAQGVALQMGILVLSKNLLPFHL